MLRFTLLAVPFLFASCQSMSEGLISLEGRAMVYNDSTVDDFDAATSFDQKDVDVTAYGVQGALMTPIVDGVVSLDWRDYEGETTPELDVGLRRRILEIGPVHPYVEANFRYGFDLDTGMTSDDFTGWNAGAGALIDLTDNLFLNLRLIYESASIKIGNGNTDIDGVAGTVGFGVTF